MDFTQKEIPTRETLQQFAKRIPELDVSAVEVLLQFLQTSFEIHHYIFDDLERKQKLSEGKLTVMFILYQSHEGIAPSKLAERACVTRATISAMLQRMIRDGLAHSFSDSSDGRGKLVALTEQGRFFMEQILPDHYLRIAQIMKNLTEEERNILITLLRKIKLD